MTWGQGSRIRSDWLTREGKYKKLIDHRLRLPDSKLETEFCPCSVKDLLLQFPTYPDQSSICKFARQHCPYCHDVNFNLIKVPSLSNQLEKHPLLIIHQHNCIQQSTLPSQWHTQMLMWYMQHGIHWYWILYWASVQHILTGKWFFFFKCAFKFWERRFSQNMPGENPNPVSNDWMPDCSWRQGRFA